MMKRTHFEVAETAVTILSEPEFHVVARDSIFETREIIQRQIEQDPFFKETMEPYRPDGVLDPVVERMCDASSMAGVGPMATVAGIVAERAVETMVKTGARNAVVDNGGDIAMFLSEERKVGLYAGASLKGLGFRCRPRDAIFGLCTSSATVGPSISLGQADAATVLSENVALADACATRLGNLVTDQEEKTIVSALEEITSIGGVEGAMVVIGAKVAMKGHLPEMIRMDDSEKMLAKHLITGER